MKTIDAMRTHISNLRYQGLTQVAMVDVEKCLDVIERELEEGYVELPKDMNGERVHVGDTLHDHEDGHDFRVDGFELWGDVTEWWAFQSHAVQYPLKRCSLVKPPTVEDVLREFAKSIAEVLGGDEFLLRDDDEMYAEFAERLRLRKEGE